jgi:hypothetical protein
LADRLGLKVRLNRTSEDGGVTAAISLPKHVLAGAEELEESPVAEPGQPDPEERNLADFDDLVTGTWVDENVAVGREPVVEPDAAVSAVDERPATLDAAVPAGAAFDAGLAHLMRAEAPAEASLIEPPIEPVLEPALEPVPEPPAEPEPELPVAHVAEVVPLIPPSDSPFAIEELVTAFGAPSDQRDPDAADVADEVVSPAEDPTHTAAGLRRRVPGAAVAGLAEPPSPVVIASRRSPDEVRALLSRYRAGLRQGRSADGSSEGVRWTEPSPEEDPMRWGTGGDDE